jgi:hypothetical protein
MRAISAVFAALTMVVSSPIGLLGQSAQAPSSVSVPRLVSVTGVYQPADGQPPPAGTVVTLLIYADEHGGTPLWQETQNVVLDKSGHYSLLLGAAQADGIPLEVFTSGEAQWLALHFAGLGEVEGARTRITSVPYALKSADANTLGGHPASAYQLAPTSTAANDHSATGATSTAKDTARSNAATDAVQAGTTNMVAKYVNSTDVGNSAIVESGGLVGINVNPPADALHVRFTNTGGSMTGLAVQNMGNTAASYSGTLFYDQNGQLGQFQGFNNSTHEYRINNIANNGSINFMLNSSSKFLVAPNGNIGIGTTAPSAILDVSNALIPTAGAASFFATSYGANSLGTAMIGRKARGTGAAPSATLAGDLLTFWGGNGYGTNGFGNGNTGIIIQATENFTDTAQGTQMVLSTTPNGANLPLNRMSVKSNGSIGMGTQSPSAGLEVSNADNTLGAGTIFATTYANGGTSLFVGRRARGTGAAPTAVQINDGLAAFVGRGRGATGFGGPFGTGMYVSAAENWTDTAQGASLNFNTTPVGATGDVTRMTIDSFGRVGIGTAGPAVNLEVSNVLTGTTSTTVFVTAGGNNPFGPEIQGRKSRVGPSGPTAPQSGDALAVFNGSGYGTTGFGVGVSGMSVIAQESFTDSAQGSSLFFSTIPLGTNVQAVSMALNPFGMLGVGTIGPLDRLQVVGDIRVGTSGTNGCIKNFAGTGIAGTCSSDRRLKRDITPFGSSLNQLTALQPVHFYWRAAEFPDRHFGEAQAYGLIAQDVEQVLPELVVTGEDGFKQVDYAKLPLLTIQAVKELKERVAELERLIHEMRTMTPGR